MADDFFETAAMLITLVLFGKYLESAVSPCLLVVEIQYVPR